MILLFSVAFLLTLPYLHLNTSARTVKSPSYAITGSTTYKGRFPVNKYTTSSGLTIVTARFSGPIVKVNLCLGSEDYPYESALDIIANKCYSDGTNGETGKTKLDLKQIRHTIQYKISSISKNLDQTPFHDLRKKVLMDFLYGTTASDFSTVLNSENEYRYLLTAKDSYYIDLLYEYFIDKAYAQSIGIESKSEFRRVKKDNKERIPNRIKNLGSEGLKKEAKQLAAAIKFNSKPVPAALLNSVPSPSIADVNFYEVVSYRTVGRNIGSCGQYSQTAYIKSFRHEYETAVKYVKASICHTKFTLEAIKYTANHMLKDLRKAEKDIGRACEDFLRVSYYKPNSNKMINLILNVVPDWKVMALFNTINTQGEIVSLDSTETALVNLFSPGLNDYNHPDFAALNVALKYCSQTEGPMFKRVRGAGYTYSVDLQLLPAEDVVRAFNESRQIIEELTQPNAIWRPALIESAKNSATFDTVLAVSEVFEIPLESMMSSFRNVSSNFKRDLIAMIFFMEPWYLLTFLFGLARIHQDTQIFAKTFKSPTYILTSSTSYNGRFPVNKYITSSGLTIVIARTYGPIVKSYLCLATKAVDDNGEPHVLEHLVFLGSIDSTCYTSSHVGKDGLLKLLPIYLDHILYPTLVYSQFITEVYHVKGDGSDGGVVYSEILANPYNINLHAMLKALYGNFGYASETGGRVENLQQNTTHEMVVNYHKRFYRPENLCVTICGDVTIDEVMDSIKEMEEKILSKPKLTKWKRPWLAPMPALISKTVQNLIPSKNEGFAQIYIAWRGPNCAAEFRKLLGTKFLMKHLSSIAIPSDFFAEGISNDKEENVKSGLYFVFSKVSVEHVDLVHLKFLRWLEDIATKKVKLDMKQINESIQFKLLLYAKNLDRSPFDDLHRKILADYLYAKLLLHRPFERKPYVQSIGIQSIAEFERMKKENKERIRNRIKNLGPEGLKKKAKELAAATKLNSRPVPDALLNTIPSPSIEHVNFYDVDVYRTGDDGRKGDQIGLDINSWPMYAEAYDFRTEYVYILVTIDTNAIIQSYRPYIHLLLNVIDASPFGSTITESSVIDFTEISKAFQIGLAKAQPFGCGKYSQTALYRIKAFRKQYETAAKHVIANLRHTQFTVKSVKQSIERMLNEIRTAVTNIERGCAEMLQSLYYQANSNMKFNSMFRQMKFLKGLLTRLENEDDSEEVLDMLNMLREFLVSRDHLAVHVATDFVALSENKTNVNVVWRGFQFDSGPKKLNIVPDWKVMVPINTIQIHGNIIGLDYTETGYLTMSSSGISDYNHKDFVPLTVALKYCAQREGPMYKRVRGFGYTYSVDLKLLPEEGVIQFTLSKSSDIVSAFNESRQIINELTQPDGKWHPTLLESAKNVAISDIVSTVTQVAQIPLAFVMSTFRNVSTNFNRDLIVKIKAVTISDLKHVAAKYMKDIFCPTKARLTIVCNTEKAPIIAKKLKE
ncbi:hypothetical protein Bhyg_13096, partial [Pseudolycoriella hygida]